MKEFQGSGFQIALPEGSADVSTYVFVLPGDAAFKPSIVVKADRLTGAIDLTSYVVEQRRQLREQTVDFDILFEETGKRGDYEIVTSAFEWGEAPSRLRQQQLYVSAPARATIYSVTATNLASAFEQTSPLFEAILASFLPNAAQVFPS